MINIATKPGYLYLLKNTLLGGYKIGITTSPSSRFKALAVGEKTEIVGYWQTDNYRELEKYYHSQYKVVRCPQSEWFNLEESDVTSIVNTAEATQFPGHRKFRCFCHVDFPGAIKRQNKLKYKYRSESNRALLRSPSQTGSQSGG